MGNLFENSPQKGQEFFPTSQDRDNILGVTDFHSEKLRLLVCVSVEVVPGLQTCGVLDSQIPRFPDSQISVEAGTGAASSQVPT